MELNIKEFIRKIFRNEKGYIQEGNIINSNDYIFSVALFL